MVSPPVSHPQRSPDPVRLAALRAYAAFRAGGAFRATAPPDLRGPRQRRLYVNLLRGMVRHQRLLEAEAARLARRPAGDLSPPVLAALVLGLYQVLLLQQADHAAVFETVELLGALGQGRAKGLVNAVLRAALRERTARAPPPQLAGAKGNLSGRTLAERTSHPDWLVARWVRRYGAEVAERICETNNRFETSGVRVALHRIGRAELVARLAQEGVAATPHPLLPGALLVAHLGALLDSPAFAEGLCTVQDAGSQLLSSWIAPLLEGWVLDACCAPGGKLTHLLELTAGAAYPGLLASRLVGMDKSVVRLRRVRDNLTRLRLPAPPLLAGDAARLPFRRGPLVAQTTGPTLLPRGERGGQPRRIWDAVLLDAPCSATGMIRKYPELKWRKHEEDLARAAALQRRLLDEAARALRPGGLLVYSTCSLEAEENEEQVDAFLARTPGFRRVSFRDVLAPEGLGEPVEKLVTAAGDVLVLPGEDRMGIYGAMLRGGA